MEVTSLLRPQHLIEIIDSWFGTGSNQKINIHRDWHSKI